MNHQDKPSSSDLPSLLRASTKSSTRSLPNGNRSRTSIIYPEAHTNPTAHVDDGIHSVSAETGYSWEEVVFGGSIELDHLDASNPPVIILTPSDLPCLHHHKQPISCRLLRDIQRILSTSNQSHASSRTTPVATTTITNNNNNDNSPSPSTPPRPPHRTQTPNLLLPKNRHRTFSHDTPPHSLHLPQPHLFLKISLALVEELLYSLMFLEWPSLLGSSEYLRRGSWKLSVTRRPVFMHYILNVNRQMFWDKIEPGDATALYIQNVVGIRIPCPYPVSEVPSYKNLERQSPRQGHRLV